MGNYQKYMNVFKEVFEVEEDVIKSGLEYNQIPEWDSIGHMNLISELEDGFDIMMEMDDIIEFSSFEKGVEILKKYDVEI